MPTTTSTMVLPSDVADSTLLYRDKVFRENNKHIANEWVSIRDIYPSGAQQPLLPDTLSIEHFAQGEHYECFMLSALSTLVRVPHLIRRCFVTKEVRQDGRYVFQFFRNKSWVQVEIDDTIALEDGEVLYIRSPTHHWWPLLLEKAYAKFYTVYDHLEGCTLQETFHDMTGNPVLNIPMEEKFSKSTSFQMSEGPYWLELAQKIETGEIVTSVLTKEDGLEKVGLQPSQQYGVLQVFSLSGSSLANDVVVELYNPFEDDEFAYIGPLNPRDGAWTLRQREKYHVEEKHLVFMPLPVFLRAVSSIQICYTTGLEKEVLYFDGEWRGESAGGNPTWTSWRKNPLLSIENKSKEPMPLMFVLKQPDQRHVHSEPEYLQCGLVLAQNVCKNTTPIKTYFVTGNNHRTIYKSLFVNSRELACTIVIPPRSLCSLGPCCLKRGVEGDFSVAVYKTRHRNYNGLSIEHLHIPGMTWRHPVVEEVELMMRTKDRLDFYVEEPTDVHILMRQTLPHAGSKSGGDAIAQDYLGIYLYDDADKKIAGVHAATNFRETSIIEHLPRTGRYALSVTCPRSKGDVPATLTLVATKTSHLHMVEPPDDAVMLPEEQEVVEEGDIRLKPAPATAIDYDPIPLRRSEVMEPKDGPLPFEDKRFYVDNRSVTSSPWIHIGDLYPEGKTQPLLPEKLSREQFAPGARGECSCLTAVAALVDHHEEVIRNCFVSKNVRRDGGYTFQFQRFGEWVKVEIDDRIPMDGEETVFCQSPTRHWWPLLLEKAYAKFYTLYKNLEGCTLEETLHDFCGCSVVNLPVSTTASPVNRLSFWLSMAQAMEDGQIALGATCGASSEGNSCLCGLKSNSSYAIIEIASATNAPSSLLDMVVTLYNPFPDSVYSGNMHAEDPRWTRDLRRRFPVESNIINIRAEDFLHLFCSVQKANIAEVREKEGWTFRSEWAEGLSGGNPNLATWTDNPIYVLENKSDKTIPLTSMIRQPDQRHLLHTLQDGTPQYVDCGMVLCQNISGINIPTYLITRNTHRIVNQRMFLNQREVCEELEIPPHSLCYLVPCGTHHETGLFQLSLWCAPHEAKDLNFTRLCVTDVDRRLPALAHTSLSLEKPKARVDFEVDSGTHAHILLTQLKSAPDRSEGLCTEEYLGVYLYDTEGNRLYSSPSATNFRRMGIVVDLPHLGSYTLAVVYTSGVEKTVPCKVEIVCSKESHVRLLESPAEDVLLNGQRLPQESVLTSTGTGDNYDHHLRSLSDAVIEEVDPLKSLSACEEVTPHHSSVKTHVSVDEDTEPHSEERVRHGTSVSEEPALLHQEESLAESPRRESLGSLLSFLEEEYYGVPTRDIPLSSNDQLIHFATELSEAMEDPTANATRINDLSGQIESIAKELAAYMHEEERYFLPNELSGVPLNLLPLNTDPTFSALEDELRAIHRKEPAALLVIDEYESKLLACAQEMAVALKERERELFLDPMPAGVRLSSLRLEEDNVFHTAEVKRLRLRVMGVTDLDREEESVHSLNVQLNERAQTLALQQLRGDRGYLSREYLRIPREELPLDENPTFVELESRRHELLYATTALEDVHAVESELHHIAVTTAAKVLDEWRSAYLHSEYRGWLPKALPLNETEALLALELERRYCANDGDSAGVEEVDAAIHAAVQDLAEAKSAAERVKYLHPFYRGVPLEELHVDEDHEMQQMEVQRARLLPEPSRNHQKIRCLVDAMHERADELAIQVIQGKQNDFLELCPCGVPVNLLRINEDEEVQRLMLERVEVMGYDEEEEPKAARLHAVEEEVLQRIREMARERRNVDRDLVMGQRVANISHNEVPLEEDDVFRDAELERYRLLAQEEQQGNSQGCLTARESQEAVMAARFVQLAKELRERRRCALLGEAIYEVPVSSLNLDDNADFVRLEHRHDDLLHGNSSVESPRHAELAEELKELASKMVSAQLLQRAPFLNPTPSGVPLTDVDPLRDPSFFEQWKAYCECEEEGQRKDLEQLMNHALLILAKKVKLQNRSEFVPLQSTTVDLSFVWFYMNSQFQQAEQQYLSVKRAAEASRSKEVNENVEALSAVSFARDRVKACLEAVAAQWVATQRDFITAALTALDLSTLDLEKDSIFRALEDERLTLLEEYPIPDTAALATLEQKILAHLTQLHHKAELSPSTEDETLAFLDPTPEGVPLPCTNYKEDERLNTLFERRRSAILHTDDESVAKELETTMNSRVRELARELKLGERSLLDQEPEGVPLCLVPLDEDEQYRAMEVTQIVRHHGGASAEETEERRRSLNQRAHELASEELARQRSFLDGNPEGVPLSQVPLDEDELFRELEKERLRLKAAETSEEAQQPMVTELHSLEERMNTRSHELARGVKQQTLVFLDQEPEGVPLRCTGYESDSAFHDLAVRRMSVCLSGADESVAKELETTMNSRVRELARELKLGERSLLDQEPEGVPLCLVPLDEDEQYRAMEVTQIVRHHGGASAEETEERRRSLNQRAHELARRERVGRRGFLRSRDRVVFEDVLLDEDDQFLELEDKRLSMLAGKEEVDPSAFLEVERLMKERLNCLLAVEAPPPALSSLLRESYLGVVVEDVVAARSRELYALVKDLCANAAPGEDRMREMQAVDEFVFPAVVKQLEEERTAYLGKPVVHGVPIRFLPLNENSVIQENEHRLRHCDEVDAAGEIVSVLRATIEGLALQFLWVERTHYLEPFPEGVPLSFVGVDQDPPYLALEENHFACCGDDPHRREETFEVQARERVSKLAKAVLARERETFVAPELAGLPLAVWKESLTADEEFHGLETQRFLYVHEMTEEEETVTLEELEQHANRRALEVAKENKARNRAFLAAYTPEIPLNELPLDDDPPFHSLEVRWYETRCEVLTSDDEEDSRLAELQHLKDRMAERVRELATQQQEQRGWEDNEFHEKNKHIAPCWPRIREVYPEGVDQPVLPEFPSTAHFISQGGDASFMAPFLACLTRTPALLERLYFPRVRSEKEPFTFVFFDPSGRPVAVDIDDRIPCDADYHPVFTASPTQSWWPLLLEKAYAKFIGGYERMDHCTAAETLRDLTGRPVTLVPLDPKLAKELSGCEYDTLDFWRGIHEALENGDCIMALSKPSPPDGLHSSCLYTLCDVIESVPGSSNVEDILIKVHNCYPDGEMYNGASISSRGPQPPGSTKRKGQQEFLNMPFSTFLRNCMALQQCHVNCGDRLTIAGEWNASSGCNPKYTSFRDNPLYLVENKADETVTCLAEVRHMNPVFFDPNNVGIFHHTALAVLRAKDPLAPLTPLLAFNSHELVQAGLLTDARDVTVKVTLPPRSISYFVPYTKKRGCYGRYQVSLYPGEHPVELSRLRPLSETHNSMSQKVVLKPTRTGAAAEKVQVDFAISEPCEVHLVLRQDKISDALSVRGGDYLAEDEVTLAVYQDAVHRLTSTGDASNAREHALAFTATEKGRYTLFLTCPSRPQTGDCPCTLTIFTPKSIRMKFVASREKQRHAHRLSRLPSKPTAQFRTKEHTDPLQYLSMTSSQIHHISPRPVSALQ